MRLTILGSGTLIPLKDRTGSSYLVNTDEDLLFDIGPGTLRRIAENGTDHLGIHHVFLTHRHNDHINDLNGLLQFYRFSYGKSADKDALQLHIYGPVGIKKHLETVMFELQGMAGMPAWLKSINELTGGMIKVGKTRITSAKVEHPGECLAYRIEHDGKSLVYSGDTVLCDSIRILCKGADTLLLDAATEEFIKEVPVHMSVKDCAEIAKESGAKTLILTHLYPHYMDEDLESEAKKYFSGNVIKAKDLMQIDI